MIDKDLLEKNIITLLGLEALPAEEKAALLARINEIVLKRVTVRIIDQIPEHEQEAFLNATADGDDVKVSDMVAEHVPNLAELIEEEVVKVKQELQTSEQ